MKGDGSCEYSDDATESDYDIDVDDWMNEQRRHAELSLCSKDDASQTSASYRLSDFDRSTFYDYDYDDDEEVNASSNSEETRSLQSQPQINEVTVVYVKYPDECCPKCCTAPCSFWEAFDKTRVGRVWFNWRNINFKIVEHKYFETFIICMILISSLALVCFSLLPTSVLPV